MYHAMILRYISLFLPGFFLLIALLISILYLYNRWIKKLARKNTFSFVPTSDLVHLLHTMMQGNKVEVFAYDASQKQGYILQGGSFLPFDIDQLQMQKLHPEDVKIKEDIIEKMHTGSNEITQIRLRSTDQINGQYLCNEYTILPIPEQKETVKYIFSRTDYTEQQLNQINNQDTIENLQMALQLTDSSRWIYDLCEDVLTLDYRGDNKEMRFTGEELWSFFLSEDRKALRAFIDKLIKGENPSPLTIRLYTPFLEEIRLYNIKGRVRTHAETGKREIYGVMNDITPSMQSRIEVENLQRNLKFALDSGKLTAFTYSPETKEFDFIHGLKSLMPYNSMENIYEATHPDDVEKVRHTVEQISTDPTENIRLQFRFQVEPGEYRWFACYFMSILDENKLPARVAGIFQDISKDMDTHLKLEESNRQNELILKNSSSGILYFDHNNLLKWTNIHALSKHQEYQAFVREYIQTPTGDCPFAMHTEPLSQCYVEQKMIYKQCISQLDGRIYDTWTTPLMGESCYEGAVIRINDVTERERMIRDLEEAKLKAEESERLKMAFLANMSHEIRTPLNAIIGFSELLHETEDLSEKKEFVKIIKNNNLLLLDLIENILDLSKIESGSTRVKVSHFCLHQNLREINQIWQQRSVESELTLHLSLPYDDACFVWLDKQLLNQILTNYLSNAFKYTTQGSITLGYEMQEDRVKIFVSDTGMGISPENTHLAFKRFSKLDDFAQGTGLGLSICKGLAQICGGEVGVDSQEGVGSTFWVWLPLATQTP